MKLRSPWLIHSAAFVCAGVVRTWLGTVRGRLYCADGREHPTLPEKERFIYAFWHESLLAPVKIRARVRVLVSQSNDGELMTQVCRRLRIGVVRGSSTRGGAEGLLDMIREGRSDHLAMTPDGPRGPRRRVKPGVVFVASHACLPIVPIGIGFRRAWRAGSWDRFAVPYPFSTITGVVGEPIVVPPQLDDESLEHYRQTVERAMLDATHTAELWAEQVTVSPNRPLRNPINA